MELPLLNLRSRLRALPIVSIAPPDEALLKAVLVKHIATGTPLIVSGQLPGAPHGTIDGGCVQHRRGNRPGGARVASQGDVSPGGRSIGPAEAIKAGTSAENGGQAQGALPAASLSDRGEYRRQRCSAAYSVADRFMTSCKCVSACPHRGLGYHPAAWRHLISGCGTLSFEHYARSAKAAGRQMRHDLLCRWDRRPRA